MEYIFDIFKLIEKSLKNEKHSFFVVDEKKFTQSLIENGLVGLVFESIDSKSFKDQSYYNLLKEVFKGYVYQDIQQQNLIQTINDKFNEAQIKHIFLKGAHLKKIYPQSYMRGMGDIDVLVPEDKIDCAKKILKDLNFTNKSSTRHHLTFYSNNNIIELHKNLVSEVEYEFGSYLSKVWENAYLVEFYLYEINIEFNYIYILTHLIRHLRTSGIGLRTFLDLYFFNQKYINIENTIVTKTLKDLGLENANEKMNYLNEIFINKAIPNEKDMEVIKYIINSGIHGLGTKHIKFVNRRVFETKFKKQNKFQFFLSQMFPKKEYIEDQYSYLKKIPWLLPWAWLVRIIKQLFKPKIIKQRIKAITNDENVSLTKEIYDYFGV